MDTKSRISKFDKLILKLLFKKYVKQDNSHEYRIIEMYKMIREASRNEFIEDSNASLNSFLQECFDKSLKS